MRERLLDLAQRACQDLNLYLLEVRIRGDQHRPVFEIFADSNQGITLQECENLTRVLQDLIDMDEVFRGDYRLNVSSPGLDRPLIQDYEFKRNIGQTLLVRLKTAMAEKDMIGKLIGFDDRTLELEINDERKIISRSDIQMAKVKIQW